MRDEYIQQYKIKHGRAAMFFLLFVFAGGNVQAACSAYQGKVVVSRYNYIDNWIELKVLDSSVISAYHPVCRLEVVGV
jgi:hypothetical protein